MAHPLEARIGTRLARLRLSRNITQAALARRAGIGVRTLRRFEAGDPSTLDTFLRIATALELDEALLAALPEADIRPIERVATKGRARQRARPAPPAPPEAPWTWGEDGDD